jgi:Carboxypeptidase regulatory-like domain
VSRHIARHIRLAVALALGASAAGAQAPAPTPARATITGTVRERLNDVPLSLATVALDAGDRVVFTRGAGAFALSGVPAGVHTLHVRQIGFAPATLRVTVPDTGAVDAGVTRLERLAVSIAAVEVRAQPSECVGTGLLDPGADAMATAALARLADQSDRQRAFATTYPGLVTFENVRERLGADSAVLETKTDSGRRRMVDTLPYHVGQVVRTAYRSTCSRSRRPPPSTRRTSLASYC